MIAPKLSVLTPQLTPIYSELTPNKYGETEIAQTPDVVFWASVYKAICGVKDTPEAIVSKAKAWLHEHGMSPNLAG